MLWWQANVVHTGDVYVNGRLSLHRSGQRRSLAGLVAAIEAILARVNDATVVIPGHGLVPNRRELSDYRDMIVTVGRRVREGVESGRNLEDARLAPHRGIRRPIRAGVHDPTRLIGNLYRDLTRSKPGLKPSGRN